MNNTTSHWTVNEDIFLCCRQSSFVGCYSCYTNSYLELCVENVTAFPCIEPGNRDMVVKLLLYLVLLRYNFFLSYFYRSSTCITNFILLYLLLRKGSRVERALLVNYNKVDDVNQLSGLWLCCRLFWCVVDMKSGKENSPIT